MRGKLAGALLLVMACGRPAPVEVVAVPPSTAIAPSKPVACALGLTTPARVLFPTDVHGLAVAAIEQTVLLVYHDARLGLFTRTYDSTKHVAGKEIALSETGGAEPRVAAAGPRFVATWQGKGNAFAGRLVGRDGTPLGAEVALPGNGSFDLAPVADGFVAAFQDHGPDDSCVVKALKLDSALKAASAPTTIAQAKECPGLHTRVIGLEVWVAMDAVDFAVGDERPPMHAKIARLDTQAHLLAPPITFDDGGEAGWGDLVATPRGALAVYATYTTDAVNRSEFHAHTLAFDASGRPLAPPRTLPDLANHQSFFSLLATARPFLTYDDGSIAPLDWDGAELSPPRGSALRAAHAAWTNVNGQPWLFWNADKQAYGAPIGCTD